MSLISNSNKILNQNGNLRPEKFGHLNFLLKRPDQQTIQSISKLVELCAKLRPGRKVNCCLEVFSADMVDSLQFLN